MDDTAAVPSHPAEPEPIAAEFEQASRQYVGQWNRLVSRTNWEKGRIICQWRMRLMEEGAPAAAYSDEAWARRVGSVSGQHVGRLRRVYEQFGSVYQEYPGLYWSHFLAALDWPDAEMWLEGAVQNGWSVNRMRTQRWQTLSGLPDERPREEDVVTADWDEDSQPAEAEGPGAGAVDVSLGVVHDPDGQTPPGTPTISDEDRPEPIEPVTPERAEPDARPSPLARRSHWPEDLADAVENLQVAILNHKLSGWQQVSCHEVLEALDALKALATAPSEG